MNKLFLLLTITGLGISVNATCAPDEEAIVFEGGIPKCVKKTTVPELAAANDPEMEAYTPGAGIIKYRRKEIPATKKGEAYTEGGGVIKYKE